MRHADDMRALRRIQLALSRGSARADSIVAAVLLVVSGHSWASDRAVVALASAVAGLIFLFASGDYSWRKGYVAGKREAQGR
jgi:hypothetical protein